MEICDLGQRPPLGEVPEKMHAMVVRQDRFGEPESAFRREVIPIPEIGPLDVLVYVMASGINYNNVWAALGEPLDVIAERQRKGEPEDFHAGGSDCSGIVWKVGEQVTNVKPGDEVVVHSGWWEPEDPWVLSGRDPMLAESTRIWGYQTNYGSYCQFARAQSHQCQPKPARLTWEEAGCFLLCASTAYRMLMGWAPNVVEEGDPVLVWGAFDTVKHHIEKVFEGFLPFPWKLTSREVRTRPHNPTQGQDMVRCRSPRNPPAATRCRRYCRLRRPCCRWRHRPRHS